MNYLSDFQHFFLVFVLIQGWERFSCSRNPKLMCAANLMILESKVMNFEHLELAMLTPGALAKF